MISSSDSRAKWVLISIILAVDVVLVLVSGITVRFHWWAVGSIVSLFVVEYVYRNYRKDERIAEFAAMSGHLLAFNWVTAVLMYFATTTRLPLVDQYLSTLDHLLGFDWLATFLWVRAHPFVHRLLSAAYNSIFPQIFLLLIVLNAAHRLDRCREFVWLYFICALLVLPFSIFLPAESAWVYFGVESVVDAYHLAHFNALRAGEMPEIVLADTQGLVTFPSFHTAIAIMVTYSARRIRVLFPFVLIVNALMIISIPTEGGHYLVDVIAGAVLTFLAIAMVRCWRVRLVT